MGDPPARDRIAERRDHRILPDQLVEGLRPVFAGEHAIGRRRATARGDVGQVEAEAGLVGFG